MSLTKTFAAAALVLAAATVGAHAQQIPTAGTLVVIPAFGEVTHANDQATATLMVEEQDKDKTAAASRVNAKMREGTEILKKADPQAKLKTYGYYTYPVYPEDRPPMPLDATGKVKPRQPASWRVGQYVEVKTTNIGALQKTVAAAQKVLALNGLSFGLAPETEKQLDDQRIAATYKNLNERIASVARAMGRRVEDAVLDTVDFEGSGNYVRGETADGAAPMMAKAAFARAGAPEVAEPSFEPGDTTLQMRLVGKVKFK
ncbi:DUF541 domain-containing protein [Massilia arenosa]|uniref:DUF541 domain-containing protein n=1 Tax=Zemynaea arenosa TaxID=2561931 RepID=A0A4Y9RXK1_9BURK|nr:SIMPL domain-containing protein [Massilia arenosa]TFW13870.1 DUF541 domain-containing protein [Massilia arenosa]